MENKKSFRDSCFLLDRGAGGTLIWLFWAGSIESDKSEVNVCTGGFCNHLGIRNIKLIGINYQFLSNHLQQNRKW